MKPRLATVPSADTTLEIPSHSGARLDRIATAAAALRAEEVRLDRLGLTAAADRCREQLRYWEFLRALFSIAEPAAPRWNEAMSGRNGTISCRIAPSR